MGRGSVQLPAMEGYGIPQSPPSGAAGMHQRSIDVEQQNLPHSRSTFLRELREEGVHKLPRNEGLQIGNRLTDAHVPHRDLELVADSDDHAALGRPVQLGQSNAGDSESLAKLARLCDGILAV